MIPGNGVRVLLPAISGALCICGNGYPLCNNTCCMLSPNPFYVYVASLSYNSTNDAIDATTVTTSAG